MQIHLVLIDSDENSGEDDSLPREYHKIVVSEVEISGYKGHQKQDQFEIADDEFCSISVRLTLDLKWQIDSKCFENNVSDPVPLLRKLPGAIFLLGSYYWHFCSDFYRWAATECLDQDTRYFGEIFNS